MLLQKKLPVDDFLTSDFGFSMRLLQYLQDVVIVFMRKL